MVTTACSFHNFDLGVGGQKLTAAIFLGGHKQESASFTDKTHQ